MNRKVASFFESNGMTIVGNFGYGIIRGYETNVAISMQNTGIPVTLQISFFASPDQLKAMEQTFKNAKRKFFRPIFTDFGLIIQFSGFTANGVLKRLPDLMQFVYQTIAEQGALDSRHCPLCGKEMTPETSKKVNLGGFWFVIDQECLNQINQAIEKENKEFEKAPNNYFKGFIGALAGGFVGAVVFVILYALEFVSAISALVSVLLGVFFYKRFKGKPNKIMVLIVSLTTIVCMLGSVFGIYLWAAQAIASEAGLGLSAFEAFSLYIKETDFSTSFYYDLGLTFFFSLLGIGYEIFGLLRSVKRAKAIQ